MGIGAWEVIDIQTQGLIAVGHTSWIPFRQGDRSDCMWAAELFGGDSGYRGGSALSIVAALMPWQTRVQQ